MPDEIPEEWTHRLQAVQAALVLAPTTKRTAPGVPGFIGGRQYDGPPTITDALRVARFVCDGYQDLAHVDMAPAPEPGVTAQELLNVITNRKDG